jgi:2,4-dienoyl-CoA reductase-like NADH-dependent reductase (Old Yellow Enzyme family)
MLSNTPLSFTCGKTMKNRFALAPMTNQQSYDDGMLSQDEFEWLVMRAKGGFGLTMTCASHVQAIGKGFPGQLGIFKDEHKPGHKRLANAIKAEGSLAVIQLHHAGMRSPKELIGVDPLCPSKNEEHGARAMEVEEIEQLIQDFISAAKRAKECDYDGVEVHGAHGYIIGQFLSSEINKRDDHYGGSLENRSRLLFEVVKGIRVACGKDFLIGVRLSPERFGMDVEETKETCLALVKSGMIDFLDISLWDWKKYPEGEENASKTLLKHFTELKLDGVRLTVAGKISSSADVENLLSQKVDFVTIGKAAILHHDFPKKAITDPQFESIETPVSYAYLKKEGLGDAFINYMKRWPGFMEE